MIHIVQIHKVSNCVLINASTTFWLGGLDRINMSPMLETSVPNSTPSLIANPAQSAMNTDQVSVAESQQQQDSTQGQHGRGVNHMVDTVQCFFLPF